MTEHTLPDTLVFTRLLFFRHEDTTLLEQQVNYFLTYAPLAALHNMQTSVVGEDVIITLWVEPMPGSSSIMRVYDEALNAGRPTGSPLPPDPSLGD